MITDKQRAELHAAIRAYLREQNLTATEAAFQQECGLPANTESNPRAGLLEMKWTSVVRLQRKVMDLESQLRNLQQAAGSGDGDGNTWKLNGGGNGLDGNSMSRQIPVSPEQFVLSGHRDDVTCVALHPRFAVGATGSNDASVKVWDIEAGTLECTLRGHTNAVTALAFSRATGTVLASASSDMSIRLWQRGSSGNFECTKTLRGHEHSVSDMLWLPVDGKLQTQERLVSCSRDTTVRVWDADAGFCIKTLSGHDEWVRCLATCLYTPVGAASAAGASGNNGKSQADSATESAAAAQLWLASGSHDHTIRLWNGSSGFAHVHTLRGHEHNIEAVSFFTGDAISPRPLTVEGPGGRKAALPLVASASRDKSIRVWIASTAECIAVLEGHDNWVRGLSWHPTPSADQPLVLVSVSDDKSIRVWDVQQERAIKTIADAHSHFITCMAFAPCGGQMVLMTGSVDDTAKVWHCRGRR